MSHGQTSAPVQPGVANALVIGSVLASFLIMIYAADGAVAARNRAVLQHPAGDLELEAIEHMRKSDLFLREIFRTSTITCSDDDCVLTKDGTTLYWNDREDEE